MSVMTGAAPIQNSTELYINTAISVASGANFTAPTQDLRSCGGYSVYFDGGTANPTARDLNLNWFSDNAMVHPVSVEHFSIGAGGSAYITGRARARYLQAIVVAATSAGAESPISLMICGASSALPELRRFSSPNQGTTGLLKGDGGANGLGVMQWTATTLSPAKLDFPVTWSGRAHMDLFLSAGTAATEFAILDAINQQRIATISVATTGNAQTDLMIPNTQVIMYLLNTASSTGSAVLGMHMGGP